MGDPYENAYYITLMIATDLDGMEAQLATIEIESFRSASGAIDQLADQLDCGELGMNFYLVYAHAKLSETEPLSKTFPDVEESFYCHLEDKTKHTNHNICFAQAASKLKAIGQKQPDNLPI